MVVDPSIVGLGESDYSQDFPFYAYIFGLQSGLGGALVTIIIKAHGKNIIFSLFNFQIFS